MAMEPKGLTKSLTQNQKANFVPYRNFRLNKHFLLYIACNKFGLFSAEASYCQLLHRRVYPINTSYRSFSGNGIKSTDEVNDGNEEATEEKVEFLIDKSKYSFLKELGLERTNKGCFDGKWFGKGEVSWKKV